MTGGRWSSQTRFTVVVIGLVLIGLGVLTTMQYRSNAGAAALVAGGVLVVLTGMSGGQIVVRSAEQETRVEAAGKAQSSGDAEGAYDRFVQLLRGHAPQALEYHEAANAALYDAAGREGQRLQPIFGYFLGPIAMSGSLIVVDIRAGTGFSIARMQTTYQALLVGQTAAFQAALVIVNAAPDDSILSAVSQLSTALDRPVVAVPWRLGDRGDAITEAIKKIKAELRQRGLDSDIDRGATSLATAAATTSGSAAAAGGIGGPAQIDAPRIAFDPADTAPQPIRLEPVWAGAGDPGPDASQTGTRESHTSAAPANPRPPAQLPARRDPPLTTPSGWSAPAQNVSAPVPTPAPPAESRRRPSPGPRLYDDSAAWGHATDLHWRGQLQQAEEAYREIVDARAHALGWDHPDTLTARDQHATVLRDLDRLAEALVECDEVLTARARILGEDHPDTLTSRSHLATIYHQLGDLTRSEAEHQQVLQSRTRVLGSNHQETLISRSNLAKVYQDMGELDRAIEEHHTVMRARARLLGPEHRDTLMSRSLLASALHHAGRLTEAESEHRSVLASRLQLLGPNHLDTAVSRHRLASVLHDLGRLDEAITEYRAAQAVYATLLGSGSPFARAAASDLALAERALRGGPGRYS